MADPGVFPSPSFNILLIEDEDSHAELIQRAFEDQDPTVRIHHVHSLTEARNFIRTHKPALIIADWRLPDGESMELLSNRDNPAAIPIILMTSQGNEKIAVDALKSGALDYVVKSPESMLDMPHLAQKAIEQWETLTDYTRTQKALFESEAQFRLLAENATDMILRITTNGEILYVSPASKAVLGYTPDEVVGNHFFQYIHDEDHNIAKEIFNEIPPTDQTFRITVRALHKNGHYIWLESSARAIMDRTTGSIIEIQTSSRDITERKQIEEALQNAHLNLKEAYEKTIEGWVHALDLRDKETEGHTQRVTELTLKAARTIGFSEEELIHIKRGALLHDMGKLAVPDEILQKPGPLNEEEWEKMRQHPVRAYEMLSKISYLQAALDIPYYHHERWDGSGYPKGLQGEDIPLSARLFAIIDVWDALSSDRPYRKKLPRDEVIAYIQEKSGTLFDPRLVPLVLSVIK